jgi:hypothetical protein
MRHAWWMSIAALTAAQAYARPDTDASAASAELEAASAANEWRSISAGTWSGSLDGPSSSHSWLQLSSRQRWYPKCPSGNTQRWKTCVCELRQRILLARHCVMETSVRGVPNHGFVGRPAMIAVNCHSIPRTACGPFNVLASTCLSADLSVDLLGSASVQIGNVVAKKLPEPAESGLTRQGIGCAVDGHGAGI